MRYSVKRAMFIGLVVNNQLYCALKHLEAVTVVLPLMQGLGKPRGTLYPHTALSNPSHIHTHTPSHSLSMNIAHTAIIITLLNGNKRENPSEGEHQHHHFGL